ncbi:MAG: gamma-glutamylcyclotransferase family protein [Ferruginibacter sp.]|nr:gamma-glutamylcyclotransferase [Ferruginibacter sp.]
MNNIIKHLFVYGSLRSGFKNPAYDYLTKYFSYFGEGFVNGKFYEKDNYPVAIASNNQSVIIGEIYSLNNTDEFSWAFEQLDDYEGLHVEVGETAMYKREIVDVNCNGEMLQTWVYWYNGSLDNCPKIETNDLVQYFQQKNL